MRAMKDSRGLTLVEVLVAMLVSFIVFLGLTETIVVAVNANVQNALREEAVRVAEEEINAARAIAFDNIIIPSALLPASDNVVRSFRNMTINYGVTRSVTNAEANLKQVTVTVSWTRVKRYNNANYSITFSTIVRKR